MKRFRWVFIVVAVVVLVLVAAEFGVRALVQSQARQAVAGLEDITLEQPTLDLGGPSVLLALVQGRFVDVSGTASAAEVPFEEHTVPVRAISYRASDIRLVSTSEAVIGTLGLTGTLPWKGLSEIAGLPMADGGDGRVLVTYTVDLLGENVLQIGISSVPVLDVGAQQVDLTQSRIDVAGIELSETVSQQIIDRVVKPISLAADEQVQATGIAVEPDGLVVDLLATELPVRR
ncbi:DUF2993 domain-containing protein [Micropruina sonneratiae]|uniref:DUF2993 domain-containing protein n=1 Tax=Micropruina sonneratiae TaxID=2986940 RepID=UPI002227619F|nr:DUF2993 domain-containing protein [Micropruina sp. KQZ13P-5]MCW3157319.1 DUF2993 domain-containing protein [Micropruina sp. KQZ13P-5]